MKNKASFRVVERLNRLGHIPVVDIIISEYIIIQ